MVRFWKLAFLFFAAFCSVVSAKLARPKEDDVQKPTEILLQAILPSSAASLTRETRLAGLAAAGVLGFFTNPLLEAVFNVTHIEYEGNFHATYAYGAAKRISAGARAYGLVLLVDFIQEIFFGGGKKKWITVHSHLDAVEVGLTVWASLAVCTIKRTLLKRACTGNRLGRVALFDGLIDAVVGVATAANVLHILSVDVGMRIKSIFAASGISALVFTLASRNLVEQLMGGLMVRAWDAIEEGESVRLGDGTEGTVSKIGLMETIIIGSDNLATRISNSELCKQRVSNISRQTVSQVKQVVRFKYSDLDKIPRLLDDIKAEIHKNCPKLIDDRCKVVLTKYEPDHVRAEVNCHFDMNPDTDEYVETRQKVLLSIANTVQKNNVEFALPSIYYETTRPDATILAG
jgi:small-conductance mechanosensitive channel